MSAVDALFERPGAAAAWSRSLKPRPAISSAVERRIYSLWQAGYDTASIATQLRQPECVVANLLALHKERARAARAKLDRVEAERRAKALHLPSTAGRGGVSVPRVSLGGDA